MPFLLIRLIMPPSWLGDMSTLGPGFDSLDNGLGGIGILEVSEGGRGGAGVGTA